MELVVQSNRLNDCIIWLEANATKYERMQSLTILIEDAGKLTATLAFVNQQMAVCKRVLNQRKAQEYLNVEASLTAQGKALSPMLMKDYVACKCDLEQYNYDLAERCSRTITHTLDMLRTCISALKEEMKQINFNN